MNPNLKKTVLIVGGDGRAHALAWKCAQSPHVGKVYVAPGNPGTALEAKVENIAIPVGNIFELVEFAMTNQVDLTIVSPEGPLADGIVDYSRNYGLKIFGPTKEAAKLETSKAWAKEFMVRHHIPTAEFRVFTDVKDAHAYVKMRGVPIVIKADKLAAGKGVVVAMTPAEAHVAIDMFMIDGAMGGAGRTLVIEDCIVGEEASFMVMVGVNGHVLPFATSQDHKRLLNGDLGPNTGGMGAYSPAPVVTSAVQDQIMNEIILPTVRGMAAEGNPFVGFLYAGVMIGADGKAKTLEFNCRLGDPETQPIMMRLKSDLPMLLYHALDGTLDQVQVRWDPRPALGVVLAAAGYPESPRKGDEITGIPVATEDTHVFHAGTAVKDGKLVTSGGRVVCVTALDGSYYFAQQLAYEVATEVHFKGMQYRRDIGHRAIGR